MTMKRRSLLVLAAALACAPAFAQQYPVKTVRITSPYPNGISPDISGRLVADKLSKYWNQPVVVEPRLGANGFIAFGAVKKAPADGYELLLVGDSHMTINPYLFKALPYDPENDYAPISLIYKAPFFIFVASDSPYKSVGDLVAAAKKDPNKVSYSTPYVGSPPHLGGALLAQLTGTSMLAVQFKEGAQLLSSVVAGDITFNVATTGSATGMLKAGRIRALASATPKRNPDAPNVPTAVESGGPAGYEVETWVGLVAPRGTSSDITTKISSDISRAMVEPDIRDRYRALGLTNVSSTPAEMAAAIRMNLKKNADVVRRMGIQPE
jgi:tripartite-type tricarboxylate transporter receptor subunit TctC